jgi:TrmH family RNA methyltransferase
VLEKGQVKLIHDLVRDKKTRRERGLFLIEGAKFVKDARQFLEFSFTDKDVSGFKELISTETPQSVAGVAKIPKFTLDEVKKKRVVVVLDGLQDPGNVGTILRACLAFDAGLILVESTDPTNPKSVRASAAAILKAPWIEVGKFDLDGVLEELNRPVYRLELRKGATPIDDVKYEPMVIIAGNEGRGITLEVEGATSIFIPQNAELESLNVAMAVTVALYQLT